MPSSVKIVAARSAGVTGRSFGLSPVASLEPITCPPRNAAAGQEDAEDARPMVAAALRVELRRAAEFAHDDDQSLVEQAAVAQIVEQSRERQIERRHQPDRTFAPV